MRDWFSQVGRPALAEALTDVCGKLEGEYRVVAESERANRAELEAELHLLKTKAADVEQLEQQNKTLKSEIAQLKETLNSVQNTNPDVGSRPPLAPKPANVQPASKHDIPDAGSSDGTNIGSEDSKLEEKYKKLRNSFQELCQANEKLQQKWRETNWIKDKWMEHSTILGKQSEERNKKIKKLRIRLIEAQKGHPAGPSSHLDVPSTSDDRSRVGSPPCSSTVRSTPSPSRAPRQSSPAAPPVANGPSRHEEEGAEDSGETDEPEEPTLPPLPEYRAPPSEVDVKQEPSSDSPVVVSEWSVRKRRREEGEAVGPSPVSRRVKVENDPDIGVTVENVRPRFVPQESDDFDNIEARLQTPRKPIRTIAYPRDPMRNGPPFTHEQRPPRIRDLSPSRTTYLRRSVGDRPSVDAQVEPTRFPSERNNPAQLRFDSIDHNRKSPNHEVANRLSPPLDRNNPLGMGPEDEKQIVPSSVATPTNNISTKAKATIPTSLPRGIAGLGEDREEADYPKSKPSRSGPVAGRLSALLTSATPGREAINLPSAQPPKLTMDQIVEMEMPPTRSLPAEKTARSRAQEAIRPPTIPSAALVQSKKQTEPAARKSLSSEAEQVTENYVPLRERQKGELQLSDFRINPKYNEGLDYAYIEVHRTKEARSCLPGCLRHCCVDHWKLRARAARPQTGPAKFRALLEKYLGDEAWRIGSMDPDEKEELWLRAKMQELADQAGGHGQRYDRHSSPPGMWRTEFPTTQEVEEDRAAAESKIREEIEARWWEATRRGRWLFKDEVHNAATASRGNFIARH